MSYYHAKKTAEAKRYLDDRERAQAIKAIDDRLQRSIIWMAKYRMSGKAGTKFDWRPSFEFTKPTTHDVVHHQPPETTHEEAEAPPIIEGEFTVVSEGDASFTDQDRTPF